MRRSNKIIFRTATRKFSSPPPQLQITPELIQRSEERVAKRRQFLQESVEPRGFAELGTPRDLHELSNPHELAAFTAMPAEHQTRTVVISSRPKKFLQSGDRYANQWLLKWKPSARWYNPLMGWSSSADPMSTIELNFNSAQDAVEFAKSNGWKYELNQPASLSVVAPGSYSYADNFLPPKVVQKMKREGKKSREFHHGGKGGSHWFQPLTYHGTDLVRQHGEQIDRPYPAL